MTLRSTSYLNELLINDNKFHNFINFVGDEPELDEKLI